MFGDRTGDGLHLVEHRAFGVEPLGAVLREVADAAVVAQCACAGLKFQLAREDFQQSGLACSVRPDQHSALAFFNFQIQILVDHFLAIGLPYALKGNHALAAPGRLWKTEIHRRLIRFRRFDALHAGELLDTVLRLCRLAGLRAEAIDEILQVRDFLLLVAVGGELLLVAGLFLIQAGVVVSVVADEFAVPDFHNATADEIQKFAVVGNR